ncbi:response regulator transcription factor [uncultured Leifsonia sp.]|uniref:response regulator n=1 Tax=uncultured Leifsonia sp. TaxID=340359 RepID=UPI0025FB0789|nr:response regulator transcription factor [uncultured Leifsonia sp.]
MSEIRLFIVDDHSVVRRGLRAFLTGEDDVTIVGEADNGRRALDEIAVLHAGGRGPDVVLMDIIMPVMDGITAIGELRHRYPEIQVIALTSVLEEDKINAALEAGARGYLLKDADVEALTSAIKRAAAGKTTLQPDVANTLLEAARKPRPADMVTPREAEVIRLVAAGNTNQQIATILGVTERTARTHVSNVLSKLGLASRTQVAMWAVENGLV